MNCCNHDCNQGGTCQLRTAQAECHVPCSPPPRRAHFFAPGVLEGPHYKRRILTADRVEVIGRAVIVMACLAALAATLGFTAGYFNFGGLL